MLNKQAYHDYQVKKKRNEKVRCERLRQLDQFNASLTHQGDITENDIQNFIHPPGETGSLGGIIQRRNEFLLDYAAFLKNEPPTPLLNVINNYYTQRFREHARSAAIQRKENILPAPASFKVNPEMLNGLKNDEFVQAFTELQQLVIAMYEDIEKSPFDWGYPDYLTTDGYYNRLMDTLFGIVLDGTCNNGVITVDAKKFFARNIIKRHRKIEMMVDGLKNFGFSVDGFSKKANVFHVSHLDNPHIITALYAFASQINVNQPDWAWGMPMNSLSYRLIEDPAAQKCESIFHAYMDYASPKLLDIQYWLRDEAAKYGYFLDQTVPVDKGGMVYKKGSKRFLIVKQGERKPGAGHFDDHEMKIGTKVSFIHAFEYAPDKMRAFVNRFPHVFRLDTPDLCCDDKSPHLSSTPHMFKDNSESSGKRCAFRMKFTFDGITYKRCGLTNFFFEDISFDDVKSILEMFLIENKI